MGTANEIEPGFLHQPDVAHHIGIRHRVSPAGRVLVDIRAAQIQMLAVEEEALVRGPLDRSYAERRGVLVGDSLAIQDGRLQRI